MLPQLLIVIGVLSAAWLFLDWFKRAKPAAARKALQRLVLGLLMALGLWLVLTGKLAGLLAVAAGAAPWIMRGLRLHSLWRTVRGIFVGAKGGRASAGGASHVNARFVRMELDHDSGRLDGQVLEGFLQGRTLSTLSRAEAEVLWREASADAESARLVEAWLDRAFPDWRAQSTAPPPPHPPETPSGKMTLDDARDILGVGRHASADEIRAAHRKLMMANHPDHGGSTWIAARINQARDLLLGH